MFPGNTPLKHQKNSVGFIASSLFFGVFLCFCGEYLSRARVPCVQGVPKVVLLCRAIFAAEKDPPGCVFLLKRNETRRVLLFVFLES